MRGLQCGQVFTEPANLAAQGGSLSLEHLRQSLVPIVLGFVLSGLIAVLRRRMAAPATPSAGSAAAH